jgi:hypothetical protein
MKLFRDTDRAACAEAREVALFGPADAGAAARVARHLQRCQACQAAGLRLDRVRAELTHDEGPLDDVTRARMRDRLAAQLDDLAASRARPRGAGLGGRFGRGHALTTLALAAAAAGALFVLRAPRAPAPSLPAPTVVAMPAPAPASSAQPAPRALVPTPRASTRPPIARPLAVRPTAPVPARPPAIAMREPGAPDPRAVIRVADLPASDHLDVPAGERIAARLADHTQIVLIGPASLAVIGANAELLELRLARGTLVGDHEHGSRRHLRVLSPDAVTDIVGTTFLVEAETRASRVAVAAGRVTVREPEGPARFVNAGEVWSTHAPGQIRIGPTPRTLARVMTGAFPHAAEAPPLPALAPALPPIAPVPVTPAPVAPPPAPPAAAALPARALYGLAEQAMAAGNAGEAQQRLEDVVAHPQAGGLADLARYELAQRAIAAGDGARAYDLALPLTRAGNPRRDSARLLLCEIPLRSGDREGARACYARFHAASPDSPLAREAVAALLALTPVSEDCTDDGQAILRAYLAQHPRAAEAQARAARCPR